ncbi:MAG: RluA family pseudouridine synthase [Isosphaeraceae bacterium]
MLNPSLVILHEDSDCLAVAKPAGQFTQGTWAPPGETTLEADVRSHLNPSDPASVYLGIVHRLDRPTSGVLLWAKTSKAARRLSSQFEKRQVVKEYWALVSSSGPPQRGEPGEAPSDPRGQDVEREETWCDWLTHPSRTGRVDVVAPETLRSRQAVTLVRRVVTDGLTPGCTWLRMWPRTGRTHQLRAQSAARGMPILGDAEYGSTTVFGAPHTIALHARSLQVRHPILMTPMTLVAPLPPVWHSFGVSSV